MIYSGNFLHAVKSFVEHFKNQSYSTVIILHHNDTDGLTSGAILESCIERGAKYKIYRYALEKPYPHVLSHIFDDTHINKNTAILITDFGSGMLPEIVGRNKSNIPVYVLDHHVINECDSEFLHFLNPLSCTNQDGTDFDKKECSASIICAYFALNFDSFNSDLSTLGLLGVLADGFVDDDGELKGVSRELFELVKSNGNAKKTDKYELKIGNFYCSDILIKAIDSLGSAGYLSGGTDIAIKGLRDGIDEYFLSVAEKYQASFSEVLSEFISKLEFEETDFIQWFILPDTFKNMGVKTVGLVCQELIKLGKVNPDKYVAGFQYIPPHIPGIGDFPLDQYKVSMRTPDKLWQKITARSLPSLVDIIIPATETIGGFVDACHPHAAAAVINIGQEKTFVLELDNEIRAFQKTQ